MNDARNCQTCGHACAAGEVCVAGACSLTCGGGTTKCGTACVDVTTDPSNCGGCGQICALSNATAACLAGSCHVVGCGAGFFDVDRVDSNGCECQKRSDGEDCNGLDDNCDGLIDFVKIDGGVKSACICEDTPFAATSHQPFQGAFNACGPTTCDPGPNGSMTMTVCQTCSGTPEFPYSTCVLTTGQDLSLFDASYGATGFIEVSFCTTGVQNAEVDLWYGTDPQRRKLVLAAAGTPAKCDTVYFAPQDACFADLAGTDPACANRCGATGQACGSFGRVPLYLTVSYCQPLGSVVNGTVQLRSVTYLQNNCRCVDDASCTVGTRTRCQATGISSVKLCAPP